MDSSEDVSTLKRKSTLELSYDDNVGRKSSRVHAVASVRAATSKLTGSSKSRTEGSMQKALSKQVKGVLSKSASKVNLTKSASKTSLTKSASKTSLTKSASKASLTKSASKASLTKSSSKTSLTKSASKASLTKSASNASLTKSASNASLTKLASLTNAVSLKSRLTLKDSDTGGKLLWFLKGCHVAVFAQSGSRFYLCRLQQNVYNSSKEVKVRWLSVAGVRFFPNIYRMSYLDKVDPVSILMQVELTQKSRLRYLLPPDQEQEIENMVRLVEDVQSGKISVQDIDDDVLEIVQIDEPPPKKPRLVKTASQRIRDKALKTASKKSSPAKKGKEPKEKKEKKEPKRKAPIKEDELKLNPRPNFKVLDKDPLFETREPMPYVSKVSNSKLVYRAINLGDSAMLRKLLKDGRRIKHLHSVSVSNESSPIDVLAKNLNKEVMAVLLEDLMEEKFKKRYENNPDDVTNMDRMDTGRYNQKSLAVSRIRKIQASRGTKEGNNAFLHTDKRIRRYSWVNVASDLTDHGISLSTVNELEEHFKKLKPENLDLYDRNTRLGSWAIMNALLSGQHKEAGRGLKGFLRGRHFASESLMINVLLFDDEDLTQCPPSAVKEICKSFDKITAIHCAAANPNSKYLSKLLSVQPNPQVPDAKGRRPIHMAAGCSSPDNLKLLLNWRVNTHDTDTDMKIPLHYAILARRADNVAAIINHDKNGSTTDPNVIRYGKGGVNRPMKKNYMPLHQAALLEDLDIARILLSNGALVNATTSLEDMKWSPLAIAAGTGNLEMVKLLVDHGAVVEQKDRLGRTPLLIACMNGATKVLSYFLHLGANPERADSSDNTPLHYAAAYGWYFTVRMLMEVGVDPNATNMWKISPLFVAYMKGHVGIVRQLLSYNTISINQVLNDGSTLLFHACESDFTKDDLYEQIEYMVKEKGALCDIKDVSGKTALFYLANGSIGDPEKASDGHQQCIKIASLLLDNGCDINTVDDNGFTALMEALGSVKNTTLVEFLVKKGCQVFAPEDGERTSTVLHTICKNLIAAKTGLTKVMEILKQPKFIKDFRVMAKCYDKAGYTPLLQLCDENIFYSLILQEDVTPENQQQYVEFVKFLVETLHSPINAVVIKKYLSPDDLLPPEDSNDWYTSTINAGRNALMLLVNRLNIDETMDSEKENGLLTAIQYLVNHGIDLNTVDRSGFTALYMCVRNRHLRLVKCLAKNGTCDVDFEIKEGNRTVHLLHICNSMEDINALLDIGCNPNVISKEEKYTTFLHRLVLGEGTRRNRDDILQVVEKLVLNESNGHRGFDLNCQDWRGRTVLHQLARCNPGTLSTSLELEYKIIQNGGDVGIQDKKGRTALHYVFKPIKDRFYNRTGRNANVDATQLTQMISKCMSAQEINTRDYRGMTALHMAAQMGASVSCVTLLSQEDKKADISLYDKDGNTALTLAVLKNHDACAVSLIQSGASLTDNVIELSKTEKDTRIKAWKEAYYQGKEDKEEDEGNESAYWTIPAAKHLKQNVKVARIPLYKAAMKNGLQGVAMLISQADPSKSGCTPLDIIKMAFDECHYNIALEILYNHWNSGQLRKLDKDGRNLLHLLAISCRNSNNNDENPIICKVAKFLIQEKMPLEQKDKFGLYPIHWAIIEHHFNLANLLAEHSITYDKDPNGRHMSYLEAALWRIYSNDRITDKVWLFLDKLHNKGMDFNRHIKLPLYPELFSNYLKGDKKDPELSERNSTTATTALIVAIRSTSLNQNITRNFLVSGASPNLADGNQVTPMMHAVMKNDADFVSLLLNYEYPECMKEKPVETSSDKKKKKPDTSIFRLKPQDDESESESDDDDDDEEEEEETKEEKKKDEKELKPVPKTSDVDLDAKDKDGRTALHYLACPDPHGTFDNAKIAFLLVKAGAKELKDKAGMTPYALAIKTGVLDVADMLKSLGHGKKDKCQPSFDRYFPVDDEITFKPSLQTKPDFGHDAQLAFDEEMEVDRPYEHVVDKSCTVQNGILMKDEEQDICYDVLLTKVDVKRIHYAAYNYYKIQLVQQSNPNLYILFTSWGCIGMEGQFQHTPFSDVAAAAKLFCKIFREKTGNKWTDVKNFQIKPRKYRLLDDSARLAPPKMKAVNIDVKSKAHSILPDHLLDIMTQIMNPEGLVKAMQRISSISMESLPFGRLSRERLLKGKRILNEIWDLVNQKDNILKLSEEGLELQPECLELCEKMAELSNEYFHAIPQKDFVYESICPLTNDNTVVRHLQTVDNLLDYEVACQMLKGAISCKDDINPADYVYRCLDCKLELMQPSDLMAQLIIKYIHISANLDDKVTGIYKVSREGESAKLEKTGLENRRLLFHGTGTSNLLSILSRGLVTIFPEHGAAYGNGIYFSDAFSKSRCYSDNFGIMLLCEVALGKTHTLGRYERLTDDQQLDEVFAKEGCSSLASIYDDDTLKNWFKLPSGVSLNLKKQVYPTEFVVVKPDQVCIRYLIKFKRVM